MKFWIILSGVVVLFGCQKKGIEASKLREIPPECFFTQASIQLDDQLSLCKSVSGKNPDSVRLCLKNLYDLFAFDLPNQCRASYHDDLTQTTYKLLENSTQYLSIESTPKEPLDLQNNANLLGFFHNVDFWSNSFVKDLTLTHEDTSRLNDQTNQLITNLWIQVTKLPTRESDSDENETSHLPTPVEHSLLVASLAMDTLSDPSLALKFSEIALAPLDERIAMVSLIQDFICRKEKCYKLRRHKTYLSETLKALFLSATDSSLEIYPSKSPFSYFLKSLHSNRDKYRTFLLENLNISRQTKHISWQKLLKTDLEEIPSNLKSWVSFIQTQKSRYDSFRTDGLYSSYSTNFLAFDLRKETLYRINNSTDDIIQGLDAQIKEREHTKIAYLEKVLEELDEKKVTELLKIEQKKLEFEFGNLSEELDSLKKSLLDDSERFSIYLSQIDQMRSSKGSIFNREKITLGGKLTFSLSGSEAKFNGKRKAIKDLAALKTTGTDQNKPQIINLDTSGFWSPRCALLQSDLRFGPTSSFPLVGPEGYQLHYNGENAELQSKTRTKSVTHYQDQNFSVSACLGAEGKILGNGLSANLCANYTNGKREEDSNTDLKATQTSFRNLSAFTSGLHLENTPLKSAPAGSLLAVITKDANQSIDSIDSIQVVGRKTSLILEPGEALYLVINDCEDTQSSDVHRLSIDAFSFLPSSFLAEDIFQKMLTAMKAKESEFSKMAQSLFDQGYATQNELNLLKSNLVASLSTIAPEISNQEFQSLNNLYHYWVDLWVLQIERKIQIIQLERQLERIAFKIDQNATEIEAFHKKPPLKHQIIQSILSNYDLYTLGDQLTRSLKYANRIIIPVIQMHFESLFEGMEGEDVEALRTQTIESNTLALSKSFLKVLKRVRDEVRFENSYLFENSQPSIIAYKIPRLEAFEEGIADEDSPSAPLPIAAQFWRKLHDIAKETTSHSEDLTFQIEPKDLYRPDLSGDSLSCVDTNIVVDSMVVALGIFDHDMDIRLHNLRNRHAIDLEVGPYIQQVMADEILTYELVHFNMSPLGQYKVGLRFFDSDRPDFESFFYPNAPHAHALYGLSPFSDYRFSNLSALSGVIKENCETSLNCVPLASIQKAYLLFKVKTRTDLLAHSIESCQNSSSIGSQK